MEERRRPARGAVSREPRLLYPGGHMAERVFDTDEVENAFRRYWSVGAVREDWGGFADMFTEDAQYKEHFLGFLTGREEIRSWIQGIMASYPELYTVYEWHMLDASGRVVVAMQNRRDNPQPGGDPLDFPGVTILQYAGQGLFSSEEDYWSVKGAMDTARRYTDLCAAHDRDHAACRTRADWGDGPAWARPVAPPPAG